MVSLTTETQNLNARLRTLEAALRARPRPPSPPPPPVQTASTPSPPVTYEVRRRAVPTPSRRSAHDVRAVPSFEPARNALRLSNAPLTQVTQQLNALLAEYEGRVRRARREAVPVYGGWTGARRRGREARRRDATGRRREMGGRREAERGEGGEDGFVDRDYVSMRGVVRVHERVRGGGLTEETRRLNVVLGEFEREVREERGEAVGGEAVPVYGKEWLEEVGSEVSDVEECAICFEGLGGGVTSRLRCGHVFHFECVSGWVREQAVCPLCRGRVETGGFWY